MGSDSADSSSLGGDGIVDGNHYELWIMIVTIRIDDGRGEGINKSYKMEEIVINFKSVKDWVIVQGLDINAVRITIRVDDERGYAISSGYEFEDAIHFFEKIQDKIIDDAVELSYKHREKILQKIKLI